MNKKNIFTARKQEIEYTEGQKEALTKINAFLEPEKIITRNNFFLLAGYSGCGKTTIAENIANYKDAVILAPTNAAVNRLRDKINNPKLTYSTIHGALFSPKDEKGKFRKTKALQPRKTYIIDECSMIDKYILDIIIEDAIQKQCKVIFMGDSFQLEPVGYNPKIFNWENSYPDKFFPENRYELTEVKRYDGSLLKIATELRLNKKPEFKQPENSDLNIVSKFSKSLAKDINENNNYVVLTSTNSKRVTYNKQIRSYRFKDSAISNYAQNKDILVSVSNNNYYSNGEIFNIENAFLISQFELNIENKKEKDLKFEAMLYKQGSIHILLIPELTEPSLHGAQIIESIENGKTTICKKTDYILTVRGTKYNPDLIMFNKDVIIATYGYAISCHKAQGQEWNNVYIDGYWLMPVWDSAKWFYTAITRAKQKVEIIQNKYLKMN